MMMTPPTDAQASDLVVAWRFQCWVTRHWMFYLSATELAIVQMVIDRTFGWKKPWEVIPRRHFARGFIVPGNDECSTCGTGLSEPAIRVNLAALISRGVLMRKRAGVQRLSYALNLSWVPVEGKPSFIETTKHELIMPPTPHAGQRPILRLPKTPRRERPPPPPLSKVAQEVAEKHSTSRTTTLAKTRITEDDLRKVWEVAFKETFSGQIMPVVKAYEFTALKKHAAKFSQANPSVKFLEFIDWVVRNWRAIGMTTFAWMDKFPALPGPGFLVKMSTKFEESYSERAVVEARRGMTSSEARADKLHRDGLSHEAVGRQLTRGREIEKVFKRPTPLTTGRFPGEQLNQSATPRRRVSLEELAKQAGGMAYE